MIAKRIPAPKASSGFQRLGAHVLNVKAKDKGADPASWDRLNAYILDAGHGGEKVAWARVSNCASTDPGWAVNDQHRKSDDVPQCRAVPRPFSAARGVRRAGVQARAGHRQPHDAA